MSNNYSNISYYKTQPILMNLKCYLFNTNFTCLQTLHSIPIICLFLSQHCNIYYHCVIASFSAKQSKYQSLIFFFKYYVYFLGEHYNSLVYFKKQTKTRNTKKALWLIVICTLLNFAASGKKVHPLFFYPLNRVFEYSHLHLSFLVFFIWILNITVKCRFVYLY